MIKKLSLIFLFLFITHNAWAVTTYFAVNGTKNWSSTTTSWDLTSSAGLNLASAAPTASIDVVFDATYTGTMTIDTATCVCKSLTTSALSAGTITLAGTTNKLAVSGSVIFNSLSTTAFAPTATTAGALTINSSATLTLNAGNLLSNLSATSGTLTLGNNLNFSAVKTNQFIISTGVTFAMGTYTVKGNTATNRVLITTNTLGTTLTNGATGATTTTFNFCDLRDIKLSTAGALDISNSQANSIGDCGGNTATGGTLTMTTSAPQNFTTAAGGNWADANWSTRVPLPQDDVTFATAFNSGVTITANMPRLGRSIDFSGATATGAGVKPTFTLGNAVTNYGSLNLTGLKAGGFTGSSYNWIFESQARSGTNTLTNNSQSFPRALYIQAVGEILQLADDLTCTNNTFVLTDGSFVDVGHSVAIRDFQFTGANTRAVTKTGNWTLSLSATGTNVFNISGSAYTWSDTAGTITISDTGNNNKTFAGAGQTFNYLSITGGGSGSIILTGANVFTGTVTVNNPKTITLPSATTTKVGNFIAKGTSANKIYLNASTGGSAATLQKTGGGVIQCDWLDVTDVNVTPTQTWYKGNNSTIHSGTGWIAGLIPAFWAFFGQ